MKKTETKENNEGLGAVIEKYLRRFYARSADVAEQANVYESVMVEVERRLISVTLEVTKGNRLKASRILGINRNTMLRKMRELNLDDKIIAAEEAKKNKPLLKRRKKK